MGNESRNKLPTQFRLRDLMVLVLMAAFAMVLFVNWIVPAREQARRNACQEKIKAVGHGLIGFEAAYTAFPPAAPSCTPDSWHSTGIENGQICIGPNWAVQILGQMDELALNKLFQREIDGGNTFSGVEFTGVELGNRIPNFMLCPSSPIAATLHESPVTQLDNLAKGNFAACLGSSTYVQSIEKNDLIVERLKDRYSKKQFQAIVQSRGVLTVKMLPGWHYRFDDVSKGIVWSKGIWMYAHGKGTKAADITDGTSKTVLVSEVLPFDTNKPVSDDIRGVWVSASMGASTYSHFTTPNSKTPDNINGCDSAATGPLKCVEIPPGTDQEGDTFAAARSQHSRGVNIVYADGSGKFITNDIDLEIWRSMATGAGDYNELLGSLNPSSNP